MILSTSNSRLTFSQWKWLVKMRKFKIKPSESGETQLLAECTDNLNVSLLHWIDRSRILQKFGTFQKTTKVNIIFDICIQHQVFCETQIRSLKISTRIITEKLYLWQARIHFFDQTVRFHSSRRLGNFKKGTAAFGDTLTRDFRGTDFGLLV